MTLEFVREFDAFVENCLQPTPFRAQGVHAQLVLPLETNDFCLNDHLDRADLCLSA